MRQVLVTFGMIFAIVELCLVLSPPSHAQATAVVNPWNEVVPRGKFWPERWDFQLVSHRDHPDVGGNGTLQARKRARQRVYQGDENSTDRARVFA